METHVRAGSGDTGNEVQTHADRTKKMFARSQAIWLERESGGGPDPEASNKFRELSAKEHVTDHRRVRQAAIDSRVGGAEKGVGTRSIHREGRSPEVQQPVEEDNALVQGIRFRRWVIVDEISMVSAKILARMEQRQRENKSSKDEFKLDGRGRARPFGGINMIFMGDFFQLPPPEGGFIADVPHSLKSATGVDKSLDPLVESGRDLFWRGAVQGVPELTETRRCSDEWWNEVVEQLRQGHLSEENHKYLHGIPVEGCTLSEAERQSRRRVIVFHTDPRLQEAKFPEGGGHRGQ